MKLSLSDIQNLVSQTRQDAILQEGRNFIVQVSLESGKKVVIKSFKIPNVFNQIAYRYFRKSKARRSFEHAEKLQLMNIGTPSPIAYYEDFKKGKLLSSYYISDFQPYDLTYRELVEVPHYPDWENILRQFTRFSYELHENGVEFKDHSPGNTLIQKRLDQEYDFYLVDLNRMRFHTHMNFHQRMYNMRRLSPKKEMVEIMSDEYAQLSGEPYDKVFHEMWKQTQRFQSKFKRKQKLKKKLGRK